VWPLEFILVMPITITVMSIFFDPHPEKSQALHAWMADEQALFAKHHAASAVLQKRCDRHYLFGMPMHWMQDWPNAHGLFIQSAEHAQLTCVDQLSYADFCLGDTGAMFGHSPTTVAQVLAEQAGQGLTCMLPAQCAAEVGERLTDVFGLPIWQMALSASDANRFVLRWVRAITQRRVVLVFDGCYHGAVDDSLVDLLDSGAVVDRPSALGALHSHAATTRVVPFNDLAALQSALADGQVAAVLAEPALTNCGLVLPHVDFWPQAHMLCQKYGSLLVMDETHTVSTALGGWSRQQGLVPDLMVVGKAVAAGLPCAVYGFSHEIAQRMVQAKQQAAPGHSGIGTTLSGNMLALTVLLASLTHLHTEASYAAMQAGANRLAAGLRQRILSAGRGWTVTQLGARIELQFMSQAPRNAKEVRASGTDFLQSVLHLFMLNRGVVLTPFHCMMLVSPVTRSAQIDQLLACFDMFLTELDDRKITV
jgi:glutamate-1-semialdehyde 2,1-aminomutase